ncbi:cytochrome P450 [Hygrophoropsis aurantiaca]|uniref:Cytochrome P450 n=1 Tax=Hygrophoropsis aurantiaca TaxID=72124 RepID=A0ACB7ZR21_9AGAM|nr:cytochrome P450 [Hygrophoropsis aurantiaca]
MLQVGYVLVIITIVVVATSIVYPDRLVGTKGRPDLPGPPGIPLLGNLLQLLPHRKQMLLHLSVLEKKYGELFSFTMPGWGRTIVINRPEWLEHVRQQDGVGYGKGDFTLAIFREFPGAESAFGSEGSKWKTARKIMRPVFSSRAVDLHTYHAMNKIIPIAKEMLMSAANSHLIFDFNNFCGRLTLAIFCEMALNVETGILTSDPSCLTTPHGLMDAVTTLNRISSGRMYNPFWRITDMIDGTRKTFNDAHKRIYGLIEQLIQNRRKDLSNSDSEGDFLSTLLCDSGVAASVLTRDTLVTLLFAGRDTTQNAIVWSLFELSRATEWIDKMRVEASAYQGIIPYDKMADYPIHLAVFHETLRLWPGVPKNARLALRDDILPGIPDCGGKTIPISKGDYVLWSDYAMMRNPKVWGTDSEIFNPGRHLDADGLFVKPSSPKFHAFGGGPRLCPGAKIAAYEFVATWAGLLPLFDFIPLEVKDRLPTDALTMEMEGSFMIRVLPRE